MLTMTTAALALMMQGAPATPVGCSIGRIAHGPSDNRIWAYKAPSPGARKTAKLNAGSAVFLCGSRRDWVFIRFANGRHGCGGIGGTPARPGSTCAEGWIERRRVMAAR